MINSPNKYIEQTNLKPDLTEKDIDQLVAEAVRFDFFGVCVPPFWVKKVKRDLANTKTQVVTVIGFPLGYQQTQSKLTEIQTAIDDGVDEVDIVMNISAFKSGMPWVKIELAKCVDLAHAHQKLVKVIVETALLSVEELIEICKIVTDAGVDIIKTSTGFSSRGASIADIETMRQHIGPEVGIKASGGIKSWADLQKMVMAGADRIGTSAGVAIMDQFKSE